jgi:hypothetical protein
MKQEFPFKVVLSGKTVAQASTLAEARAEAKRVGGIAMAGRGYAKRNPSEHTYKVIVKGKVVAEATSEREAHKEALRVGGVVGKSALRNPSPEGHKRAADEKLQWAEDQWHKADRAKEKQDKFRFLLYAYGYMMVANDQYRDAGDKAGERKTAGLCLSLQSRLLLLADEGIDLNPIRIR